MRDKDPQIAALKMLVSEIDPDILFLSKVDYDAEHKTLNALQSALGYAHAFTLPPNSMKTYPVDLDGDGIARDRQSWARYAGEGGMTLFSKHPITLLFHLNDLLWRDLPGATLAQTADGAAFPSQAAHDNQLLFTQGLWAVQIQPEGQGPISLILFHNQTPAFDSAEDINGLRNRDQLRAVRLILDGTLGPFPDTDFIIMGNANLDPNAVQGDRSEIRALLKDPRLQDAQPTSAAGGTVTANWDKPGPMRVSYILPSREWTIEKAAILWPETGPLFDAAEQASRHRMIWMDLTR
jgi:hypothetical protein